MIFGAIFHILECFKSRSGELEIYNDALLPFADFYALY